MGAKYENYNKIVHINTNEIRGGAAKFVWRLHRAQCLRGLESNIIVGFKEGNSPEVGTFPIKLDLKVHRTCIEKSLLDYSLYGSHRLVGNPLVADADILHFHNLHGGYFNPFSLSGLSSSRPSVWTMHDMYPITGHCAYSFDCDRWEIGCGECPHLESYCAINNDSSATLFKDKKMIYDHSVLNIVTPTKWMEDKVRKSILKDNRVQTIYHGIDTSVYSAGNKKVLREKYGIPDNKVVIGISANGGAFGDPRKGGYYINKCLEALDERGIDYAFVNIGAEVLKEHNPRIINAGYITEEKKMAELYSTLDIFLFPSLSESFGLVVVEALSCGVPVVAFNSGAISEIVDSGNNGLLVDYKDEEKLIKAVMELVANESLRNRYSHNAREFVCKKFGFDRMVDEYLKLYDECIRDFSNHESKIKPFAPDMLPSEIKNDEFYKLEASKTGRYFDIALQKKSLKVTVLINSTIIQPSDSVTYCCIRNQSYKNISVRFGNIDDLKMEDIEGDLVYYVEEGYWVEPHFLEDVTSQYVNEDAICCMMEVSRENGTEFYKPVLPDIYEKGNIYKINSIKHNNIVFNKDYFVNNLEGIKNMKYLPIDTFDLLNFKLVKTGISRYIEDITKHYRGRRLFIYGAGGHTVDLLRSMDAEKIKICGIIDRNPDLENTTINGITVYNAGRINELNIDCIIISSAMYETEIFEVLRRKYGEDRIIKIYGGY